MTCSLKDLPTFYQNASKSTPLEFCEKISSFLEKVIKDTNKRKPGLPGVLAETETADYVISSLVGTQLSIRLKETLFSLFLKKFNSPIHSLMSKEMLSKFAELINRSTNTLVTKHTEDLCTWAGNLGQVYLADTYIFNKVPLISTETLQSVFQTLEKRKVSNDLAIKQWHWIANKHYDYTVTALL